MWPGRVLPLRTRQWTLPSRVDWLDLAVHVIPTHQEALGLPVLGFAPVPPTVSTDTGVNSDMNPDEAELRNEHATFLEVTVHGNPADPRVDNIGGDLTPQWGLHLVDVNLGMDNIVGIVRQQVAAWRGGR